MAFLVLLAIAVALLVISYALMPKPKQPKPQTQDMDSPTAEAGREVPVIFGTITVKATNILDFTDKSIKTYEVKV